MRQAVAQVWDRLSLTCACKSPTRVQGSYLRGSLTRSLAEGAQSLWQNRVIRAPAVAVPCGSPGAPPDPSTAASPRASLPPAHRPCSAHTSSSRSSAILVGGGRSGHAHTAATDLPLKAQPTQSAGHARKGTRGPQLQGSQPNGHTGALTVAPPSLKARPATAQPKSSRSTPTKTAAGSGLAGGSGSGSGSGVRRDIGVGGTKNGGGSSSSSSSSKKLAQAGGQGLARPSASIPARPSTAPAASAHRGKGESVCVCRCQCDALFGLISCLQIYPVVGSISRIV